MNIAMSQTPYRTQGILRVLPVLLALSLYISCVPAAQSASKQVSAESYISNGGFLLESETKKLAYRENDLFIPGSTLKIATSLMALDILGEAYKFPTYLYLDQDNNLYIKGFGDPFLTSEEVLKICIRLKNSSILRINTIYLDDSAFALEHPTPGTSNSSNPYDAPNGAIAVNFNSITVIQKSDGTLHSGEVETPDLPILEHLRPFLEPQSDRLNIGVLQGQTSLPVHLEYAGQLFGAQLRTIGISVAGPLKMKTPPTELQPILVYKNSHTLGEILRGCLRYSNNFIANQILLACCLHLHGAPVTWEKAEQNFTNYLRNTLGLSDKDFIVKDGAGLSRNNAMSATALVKILKRFSKYSFLLNQKDGALVKSGTLEGIYCYAGYIPTDDTVNPFAIFLNQSRNSRDKVLDALKLELLQNQ